MKRLSHLSMLAILLVSPLAAEAQPEGQGGSEILKLKTLGPSSFVSALAFSPDGKTLYAAGWDKVVHVWQQDDASGRFEHRPDRSFRVPIGPGLRGSINAIALSSDGRWLAAAGRGPARGLAGFRDKTAWVLPSAVTTEEQRLDSGQIYIFDTNDRSTRVLRGHNAPVISMEFAADGERPMLVSAAQQRVGRDPRGRDVNAGAIEVWDVLNGNSIAKLDTVPVPRPGARPAEWEWRRLRDPAGWRPSIAVWRTGQQPNQLRVAIAWGDNNSSRTRGMFRVWDVAANRVSTAETGKYPLVVESLSGDGRAHQLVAGGHLEFGGWSIANAALNAAVPPRSFEPFADLGQGHLPKACTLFSSRPDGGLDRAAVAVEHRIDNATSQFEIQLLDVDQGRTLGRRIPLWGGPRAGLGDPVIAATGQGGRLAVAGNKQHTIRVYDTSKLLAGDASGPQILQGAGLSWQNVTFIKKGDALGLRLAGDAERSLAFDISNRIVVDNPDGWEASRPDAGGWRAEYDRAGRHIRVLNGDRPFGRPIVPPAEHHVTAFSLAPPSANPELPPLVAVASQKRGEPILSLFDAAAGKELRRFAGHIERIRGLSFSADRRLLASVAHDRTVRVWWVADITETLGKLGRVPGLLVEEREGRLVVVPVQEGSPADGKLRAGDVILSARTNGAETTFKSRWEFYQFLATTAPGTPLTLTVSRGRQEATVALTTEQGIDQRNPLFSLFFHAEDPPAAVSWIGWHPIGPYVHSDRDAERFLGWHFNTGDPDSPTRFASADQYRNNYDEDLLKRLIGQGPPGVFPPKPEPGAQAPALEMDVEIIAAGGGHWPAKNEYDDFALIDKPDLSVAVGIDGASRRRLKSIGWKLDDGAMQEIPESDDPGTFLAPLPQLKRGQYKLQITAEGADALDSPPPQTMTFLYLRPRPKIEIDPKSLPQSTGKSPVAFAATVENVEFAGPVTVTLLHNQKAIETWTTKAGEKLKIKREIELAAGRNLIELRAQNSGALKEYAEYEASAPVAQWIDYRPEPGPPIITLAEYLHGETGAPLAVSTAKPVEGEQAARPLVVTDSPRIRLKGAVTAADLLADVRIVYSETKMELTPGGFEAGAVKRFALDETIELKPGRQTVTVRAVTDGNKAQEAKFDVEYLPLLPTVAQFSLQTGADAEPVELDAEKSVALRRGRDPQTVTLIAQLEHPRDSHPAQAQLQINGEAVGEPQPIEANAATLQQQVTLHHGANDIRYVIASRWRSGGAASAGVALEYRRPPAIAALAPPPDENQRVPDNEGPHVFNFAAKINSDADLPLSAVDAEINGLAVADKSITLQQDADDKSVWVVAVNRAALDAGKNHVRLLARNGDGPSEAVEFFVNQVPSASKPKILLETPGESNVKVSTTEVTVEFRVRSETPLSRVDLVLSSSERGTERRISLGANAPDGRFSKKISLSRGMNQLLFEAQNDGGSATRLVYVNVVLPPISIVLDKVVPLAAPGESIVEQKPAQGNVHLLPAAPDGHVAIHGHVDWQVGPEMRKHIVQSVAGADVVRVWVNGFLRMARLRPAGNGAERDDFTLDVVLNRRENRIEFEHVALPVRDDNRRFQLTCRDPELRQRLHLVMIGVRKVQERPVKPQSIVEHAEAALMSSTTARAFTQIERYEPLVGRDAVNEKIRRLLRSVARRIHSRARRQRLNDVVVVYYHGKEMKGRAGDFLLADFRNWKNPIVDRSAISSNYLSHQLNNRIPGAHLVLLDVNHDGPPVAQRWPRDPHLGLMRIDTPADVRLLAELQQSIESPDLGNDVQLKALEAILRQRLQADAESRELDSNIPLALEDLNLGGK